MATTFQSDAVIEALRRASNALLEHSDYLTELDQAMGDGDTGITLGKVAQALLDFADAGPNDDIGNFLAKAGMGANKAAPSTLGTLTATALMRAGKIVKGKAQLTADDLAAMFRAAADGIKMRGKAKLGDKTVVDALDPASSVFSDALSDGSSVSQAFTKAIAAAQAGRDSVTPLRSKIGRASWVGERTAGKVDPGCEALVIVLEAINNP